MKILCYKCVCVINELYNLLHLWDYEKYFGVFLEWYYLRFTDENGPIMEKAYNIYPDVQKIYGRHRLF